MYTKKCIGTISLFLTASLMGCTYNQNFHTHDSQHQNHQQHESYTPLVHWQQSSTLYRPQFTHKLLSDYTETLAMELVENMRNISHSTPIAVTSFVDLNDNLKTTSALGNQLAENFIHELQVLGLPVADYKHTGEIEITTNGDFVFSRENHELTNTSSIDYILSGTIIYNDRGAIINARIIGRESKIVVSSASTFIPAFMIESIQTKTS